MSSFLKNVGISYTKTAITWKNNNKKMTGLPKINVPTWLKSCGTVANLVGHPELYTPAVQCNEK
jgi:hypothetical protein